MIVMQWVVWFKDGNLFTQHNNEGKEIAWQMVRDYHNNVSDIIRVAWVPIDPDKVHLINSYYEDYDPFSHVPLPIYHHEVRNGDEPYMSRRSATGLLINRTPKYVDMSVTGVEYFYIIGSGGQKVKDDKGMDYFINGCYMAIDKHGHVRLDTTSKVYIPVIPPEHGDASRADIKDKDKRK